MDKDYETFLKKYIPSKDVRTKIIEMGYQFSDWDRATIIWNSDIPLREKHSEIQRIADKTSDTGLREQILERITYDEEVLRLLAGNSDGFIYALNSNEYGSGDDIIGYFEGYDMALEEGRKIGFSFSIEKHQVINENTERIKGQIISSPFIEPDESKQIEEMDYYCAAAKIEFDRQGQILDCWSNEIPKERAIKVVALSNKRFENRFVVFPKVFEENEKVRYVGKKSDDKELIGWVNCGSLDYDEFIKKATAENAIEDYSDAALLIDYWDEDYRTWDHSHILPIYIERVSRHNQYASGHQADIWSDKKND